MQQRQNVKLNEKYKVREKINETKSVYSFSKTFQRFCAPSMRIIR